MPDFVSCKKVAGIRRPGVHAGLRIPAGRREQADRFWSTSLPHVAVVVKTGLGSHFGVGAPPILEPILVGIGMITGGTGFRPMAMYFQSCFLLESFGEFGDPQNETATGCFMPTVFRVGPLYYICPGHLAKPFLVRGSGQFWLLLDACLFLFAGLVSTCVFCVGFPRYNLSQRCTNNTTSILKGFWKDGACSGRSHPMTCECCEPIAKQDVDAKMGGCTWASL